MTEQETLLRHTHKDDPQEVELCVRRLAPARDGAPTLLWLGGFKSVMTGGKASHVVAWAAQQRLGAVRLDYSGHGQSSGRFEEGTIGRWLAEAGAVAATTTGPLIVIGSSMGGWLALLLARAMRERIAAIVLLAPAIDMTERLMWARFPEAIRQQVLQEGVYRRPSAYGDGDYPITRALIEEGRHHLLAGETLRFGCPVRILHGMQDPDVPWQGSLDLVAQIADDDVVLHLIKDGEHRLSRPADLDRLTGVLSALA